MEGIQQLELTSIAFEQGNNLESPPNDLPRAKVTTFKVVMDGFSGTMKGLLDTGMIVVGGFSGTMKGLLDTGMTWIVVPVDKKLFSPIRGKLKLAGEGAPVHGNGMRTEHGHDAGDIEGGVSITISSPEGSEDNPDQEGTEDLISEEAGQPSVGAALLADLSDAAKAAEYFKHPKTYLSGFLIYGLHSSLGTLKEDLPKPSPAKKALWYLLFGNVGTIFVLFTMLALAPKRSDKEKLLVKSMTAAGVLLFGLNLALLYVKYQP